MARDSNWSATPLKLATIGGGTYYTEIPGVWGPADGVQERWKDGHLRWLHFIYFGVGAEISILDSRPI
jgi:hypothetical protein